MQENHSRPNGTASLTDGLLPATDNRTVIILDLHAETFARILGAAGYAVHCVDSLDELIAVDHTVQSACVMLDLELPGLVEATFDAYLAQRQNAPSIIFTTSRAMVPLFALRAVEEAAVGLLTKPVDKQRLLSALEKVLLQRERVRRHLAELAHYQARFRQLTPREREVFNFVVSGHLNKQIAATLGTSEKTIKVHRGNLMRKMHVASVAALVHVALQLQTAAQASGLPFDLLL